MINKLKRRFIILAMISLAVLLLDGVLGQGFAYRYFCVYRAPLGDPLTYLRFFTHAKK